MHGYSKKSIKGLAILPAGYSKSAFGFDVMTLGVLITLKASGLASKFQ